MTVRVRFAPSPTGPLHLGNARIAVINWLYAKKSGGVFVLRVEDTDEKRFDQASEKTIIRELLWLGIRPDEGPGFGGTLGPYRQSERRTRYTEIADRLLADGCAYRCFCTDQMLEEERRLAAAKGRPPRYSGRCRLLTERDIASRAREPFAVRFKADFSEIRIDDLVHGQVAFSPDAFGDFVIMRADGAAVYNFSSAVDDALMGITHVIRGEDHLPNTPRQVLIYRALGHNVPTFAHLPLLLNESGEKIKKREGGFDLESLINQGFIPEGMLNYLASIGNPAHAGKRVFSAEAIARDFNIERLGRAGVRVDIDKMTRINATAIRGLTAEDLAARLAPVASAHGYPAEATGGLSLVRIADCVRDNILTLNDAAALLPVFFDELPPIDESARAVLSGDDSRMVLRALLDRVSNIDELSAEGYLAAVSDVSRLTGRVGRELLMPIRAALTGMEHGPALDRIAETIGPDLVKKRLARALDLIS
jgi:glutamyl-tRNA synthetase